MTTVERALGGVESFALSMRGTLAAIARDPQAASSAYWRRWWLPWESDGMRRSASALHQAVEDEQGGFESPTAAAPPSNLCNQSDVQG